MATAQARNTPSLRLDPRVLKALRLRRGLEKQKPPGKIFVTVPSAPQKGTVT